MSAPFRFIGIYVLALAGVLDAQTIAPDADWKKIHDQQPASLHLQLKLPKDHYFQGEKIDATLDFSNYDPKVTYGLMLAGSAPGAKFHAVDDKGNRVIDPLGWCQEWLEGLPIDEMVQTRKLGQATLTLPVNENVRFDQPGVYTIYAKAQVSVGADPGQNASVALVSNPVSITIDPLTPAQEKLVIADSLGHIGSIDPRFGPDAPTCDALDRLKYLQTPAARSELIKLMNQPPIMEYAAWGLEAAPDPADAATHLLAAVKSGQVVFNPYGLTIYAELKSFPLLRDVPANESNSDRKARYIKQAALQDAARKEMSDALTQAPHATGQGHAEALWTAFEEVWSKRGSYGDKDADGGVARRAVAEHQLELSDATVHRLLEGWTGYGSADFLPLVRREAARRGDNPNALIALCMLQPDEARPLVLAELARPDSNFFKGTYVPVKLLAIPPMPLPEMDTFFRTKLADPNEPPGRILPLIASFGSTSLMPDVLNLYQHHGTAYNWGGEEKMDFRFYWMRCDPKEALADFEQALQSGDDSWTTLYMTMTFGWTDSALPFVREAFESAKPMVSGEALDFLIDYGDDSDLGAILKALERIPPTKENSNIFATQCHSILANPRFHPTAEQKKRLAALAPGST